MTFTRARDLLGPAAVVAVAVYLAMRLFYGDFPPLPRFAGTTLLAFAIGEAVFGYTLRARIQRRPGVRPVQALTAAKAVALAKASSLAGALTGAGWLGVLGHVAPRRSELVDAASDTTTAVIGLVGALALVAGALWLEHCCRTPDDPRGDAVDDPP